MLKGRIKGLYLRGDIYWFAKQVNRRRSMVSLETRDYVEAVQRAREIMDAPELQPAQSFRAEVARSAFENMRAACPRRESNSHLRFRKSSFEQGTYVPCFDDVTG